MLLMAAARILLPMHGLKLVPFMLAGHFNAREYTDSSTSRSDRSSDAMSIQSRTLFGMSPMISSVSRIEQSLRDAAGACSGSGVQTPG